MEHGRRRVKFDRTSGCAIFIAILRSEVEALLHLSIAGVGGSRNKKDSVKRDIYSYIDDG
jgi:hypothetical protein